MRYHRKATLEDTQHEHQSAAIFLATFAALLSDLCG
jgi:hypothetical protein